MFEGVGSYIGEVSDGVMHGYGRLYNTAGQLLYEGEFNENKFAGVGVQYSNGLPPPEHEKGLGAVPWTKYEGIFYDNQREGLGRLFFADGSEFSGHFKDGKAHGIGAITWIDGTKQTGEWKENVLG